VDFLFVASTTEAGPEAAVRAIRRTFPDLHTFSNRELVDRINARDFSYFRQISFALSAITLCFAFLLIATLLTVSVNQRLGEIAALRALGFRRGRVVADLLWESCLMVGCGGLLALQLGGLLALQLNSILRSMPGIPQSLHFFVFHSRAVVLYALLLSATGLLAALYPVYLAARLPIAATLRKEVVS
jgi:ABC-type lipoprotein release transport system permease subunit